MPQKFIGKHQDRSLFFNKVDVCKLANQNHVSKMRICDAFRDLVPFAQF